MATYTRTAAKRFWPEGLAVEELSADARPLTQEFASMLTELEGEKINGWLEEAETSSVTAIQRFAIGLKKGLDAVRAALIES